MENESIAKDKELNEEELGNVSGGSLKPSEAEMEKARQKAAAEGYTYFVDYVGSGVPRCTNCKEFYYIYAKSKTIRKIGFDTFVDCKCFNCGHLMGNIKTDDPESEWW